MNALTHVNAVLINISLKVDAIARQKMLCILFVGILSFGGSWLVALHRGMPQPCFHDEFCYLLESDTFAHGRTTNPTHPLWEHFETFHELMKPSYMAKFPPGQGVFLAIGQVLLGKPIYGVWLSAALMCMAICWMLYGWMPPRWALIGGLIAVLQFGVFTYWSQSYWGGAVSAMGGAVVFGAFSRIFKYKRTRDALWLGLGIAVLANSRPLEGIIVGIPVCALVLPWKINWHHFFKQKLSIRVILPLSIILLMTLLGIGTYNKAITGNAGTFPSLVYLRTYSSVPLNIWKPLRPPVSFNHKVLADFEQTWVKDYYIQKRTWSGFINDMTADSYRLIKFFFGYLLAIPSLVIVFLIFCRWKTAWRFFVAILILLITSASIIFQAKPHYFAPLTALAIFLIVSGLRFSTLKLCKRRYSFLLLSVLIIIQFFLNLHPMRRHFMESFATIVSASAPGLPPSFTREKLKDYLLKKGGKHVVIVQYASTHWVHWEWVYNAADIDHSPIVWARDMGALKNAQLLEYFKDRQVWYIEVYRDYIDWRYEAR